MSSTLDRVARWILVADDDVLSRELWSAALTQARFRVVTASTGREALELIRAIVPDLVLLDLRMPDMQGQDVLECLQSAPLPRAVPVLIVSGFLEDVPRARRATLNVAGYLSKPLALTDLISAVRAALPPSSQSG